MTVAAYRYRDKDLSGDHSLWNYKNWNAPKWSYSERNCKGDLPEDATIEPMYTQAYVQELEKRCERLQSLYNLASCSS